METFISQKEVIRVPMTRQQYNDYRGWKLPEDEDGEDEGYLIEYLDGSQSNHEAHQGYISWTPKDVSDRNCISTSGPFDVGMALKHLQNGNQVSRQGWNGPGQYISRNDPHDHSRMSLPYLYIATVTGDKVPWLASQTDLLAKDWFLVKGDRQLTGK